MNVFTFSGNVGKASDIRYTQNGDAVLQFSVAVRSGFGKNENTTWVSCNLWGKRAESLSPYIQKGTQVVVSGELNNRKWTNKEGQDQLSLEVRVNDLTLVGGKSDTSDARQPAQSKPKSNQSSSDGFDDFDDPDSIPF
jgi:single-strand DNA-binding protein